MVGVPRSSGCRICVQRRVRCDGARPTCNNCKKGNRPCPGYSPSVKFQDEGPKLREKFQKEQQSAQTVDAGNEDEFWTWQLTPSSGASSVYSTGPVTPVVQLRRVLGFEAQEDELPRAFSIFGLVEGKTKSYQELDLLNALYRYTPLGETEMVPHSLDMPDTAMSLLTQPKWTPEFEQVQLLHKFTQALTPPNEFLTGDGPKVQNKWLLHLPDLTGTSLLLDAAVRAVTLVHIGRVHNDDTFMMESRPYYGKALRLLATAIADKEMGMDNKTLCATILLSFYEMFASSDDASWVRHAGGAGTLMRLRGPARHRTGFDRDIFLAYRHTLVIEAMSHDVPSFLDEPEWRQLSADIHRDMSASTIIPLNRRPMLDCAQDFYSQMATISVVNAQAERLRQRIWAKDISPDDEPEIVSVCQRLEELHRNLEVLQIRWQKNLQIIGKLPPLLPVNDPVIRYQYEYSNVFIASLNVGFPITFMLINALRWNLLTKLGQPTEAIVSENIGQAAEACQNIDYLLKSSFLGPFFAIFALRFTFRIFPDGDIRKDWALCKLIEIGDRRMMFAKSPIHGGPGGTCERPEKFWESARKRLDEYNIAHWRTDIELAAI